LKYLAEWFQPGFAPEIISLSPRGVIPNLLNTVALGW